MTFSLPKDILKVRGKDSVRGRNRRKRIELPRLVWVGWDSHSNL